MEKKEVYSKSKIQSIIMEDLVFRSPLWALLILLIYGIIMSGAMWFLLCVVKPSVDRRMHNKQSTCVSVVKVNEMNSVDFECVGYVRNRERK